MPTWLYPASAAHITIWGGVSSRTVRAARDIGRGTIVSSLECLAIA
jgi:hypothetical protein